LSSKTLQAAANSASIIIKGAMQSQLQQQQQLPQPIQQKMVHAEVVQDLVQ
jgi:hypothetical protein